MSNDTAIREAAQRYMSRGWAIIALYGVDEAGRCGCGERGAEHPSAGKHPIGAGGVGAGWMPPISDAGQLPAGANIGLKTGLASGVFALDVDPKNGGDIRLDELEAEHGPLPPTWTQRTGSGGRHYVFSLPEGFTPTNSRGRLPVGLDIRGEGGQIVLAPSVSAVGPYGDPDHDPLSVPALPAPSWLLDLIRPLPPITIPAGMDSAYMPAQMTDRGTAYAHSAVRKELARLELATPGERNQTAFRVACRLIELANAPWSGLTEEAAASEYVRFGWTIVDSTFTERELWTCWRSAAHKIGYAAAILPAPPGGHPVTLDWGGYGGPPVAPPFSETGGSGASAGPPPGTGTPPVPGQRDPFDDALPGGEDVRTRSAQPSAQYIPPGQGLAGQLVPRSQIGRIPRPVALIHGTLWRDTDAWLIGASGSGKSFIALDWAAHVAAGVQWNNRRTVQGAVLYLVAEGASGMEQRLEAWEAERRTARDRARERGVPEAELEGWVTTIPDALVLLPIPVQVVVRSGRAIELSPGWRELMGIVAVMRPALIVLDTQARISLGLNENDNAEMGMFIEAVAMLRRQAAGCCVLVVHHTGRNGGDARGASAIDGAQDVEWKVERKAGSMTGELVMEKSKNGKDGERLPFAFVSHRLWWDDGEQVSSLALDWSPAYTTTDAEPEHRTLAGQVQAQIMEILREGSLAGGATKAEIRRKVNKLRADRGLPPAGERTVDYALDSSGTDRSPGLLQKDLVVQDGQRFADRERYDARD